MDSPPRLSQCLALAALAIFLLLLPLPRPALVFAQEGNDAPTASISAGPPFTAAESLQVDISFNKPCYRPDAVNQTGFQCSDAAACDLLVYGDGVVFPSSLNETEPGLKYSLQVNLSTVNQTGKVVLAMQRAFCVDSAGRLFQRTVNSNATVRFDRNPVTVNVWTPIAGAQLQINNEARTVEATNSTADLLLYLDFSSPVLNSSFEIGSALLSAHAMLFPTERKSKGNRRFAFKIQTNLSSSVVSVALPPNTVYGRSGLAVEPASVACLYDPVRPSVKLVTQTPSRTRDQQVSIVVQFSEPVFGFNRSGVGVTGGTMTSFVEQSKQLYDLQVYVAADDVVSVVVGENKAADVAGNANLASNTVQVRHYTTPAVSVALSSFVTVGLLATAVASGTLAISSATLAAAGALASRTAGSIGADPSRNLLGMASHVQVLALSSYLAVSLPIKYSEAARGLRWTIPNVRLPWEEKHSEDITPVGGIPSVSQFIVPRMLMPVERIDIDGTWLQNRGKKRQALDVVPLKWGVEGHLSRQERRLGANGSMYGPPLSATEYETFFLNGSLTGSSPLVLSSVSKHTTHGWWGFGRNLFWLGTVGGALIVLHMVLVALLRWRTRTSLRGALSFPRFELFLLILAVPCVCQASAFLIRGGTAGGIVVGVLLLAVPVSLFLSVGLFLVVAVFMGAFVQYEEVRSDEREKEVPWIGKVLRSVGGKNVISKWVRREGLAPTFLPRYGLLFEDRKGPPKIKTLESGAAPPRWVYSGANGIGRMRAVDTSDESEAASITDGEQVLGSLRSAYLLVDIARRILLGVVAGAYYTGQGQQSWSQVWVVWTATLLQLAYLVACKPFVRRGVQLVETISVLCELGIFTASLVLLARDRPADDDLGLSIFMLVLLLLSFVAQLVNEWYALMNQLLKLAPTEDTSLKLGVKMLVKGLLLPMLPRSRWCSYISPQILQPKPIGVVSAIPPQSSPEPPTSSSPAAEAEADATSAAPVQTTTPPRYAPGSPVFIDPRAVVSLDVDDGEAGEIRAADRTPPSDSRSRKSKSRRRLKSKSASEESSTALEQLMESLDVEASPKLAGFRTPPEPTGSAPALV